MMDARLAQPGGGEKRSSALAPGSECLTDGFPPRRPAAASPALIRLLGTIGIPIDVGDLDAAARQGGGRRLVGLLDRRLAESPAFAGFLVAHPDFADDLVLAPPSSERLVFLDVGPFRLDELAEAAEADEPLFALARRRSNGEDLVYGQLCRRHGLAFVALDRHFRPIAHIAAADVGRLAALSFADEGGTVRVLAPPLAGLDRRLAALAADGDAVRITTPRRLEARLRSEIARDVEAVSTGHLAAVMPLLSARRCPGPWQGMLIPLIPVLTVIGMALRLRLPMLIVFLVSVTSFLGLSMLRLSAFLDFDRRSPEPPALGTADLPAYTVLVAVYREAAMMGQLIAALDRLDYPRDRLDVIILTEADDFETRAATARHVQGRPHMRALTVPPGHPRTKPRALAYGLAFARGELVTVYDAEDRPAPDQLKRAAAALCGGPDHLACVQARLEIGGGSSWLERQFRVEYACLFSAVLPWLGRAELPLPLGGTSNHFKRRALEIFGGWDPYNVTEDADLGLRLHRFGFTTGVSDSVTVETAPDRLPVWLRQRRRWIKGWLVTWFVHLRRPGRLVADLGWRDAMVFHLHMTANVLAPLAHPVWLATMAAYATGALSLPEERSFFDTLLIVASVVCAVAGYGGAALLGWRVLGAQGLGRLRRELLLQPVYWLLSSWAAWRALIEILSRPHFWDKTPHEPLPETPAAARGRPPQSS
jgi:cellulose synthase/poly-beta-1,6-N-acetylglucosamine synthase-like glycosyltransferase